MVIQNLTLKVSILIYLNEILKGLSVKDFVQYGVRGKSEFGLSFYQLP